MFITIGPYQATGSSSGFPETSRNRIPWASSACLIALYWLSKDPFFLVVLGVVLIGVALTLTCYLMDRAQGA